MTLTVEYLTWLETLSYDELAYEMAELGEDTGPDPDDDEVPGPEWPPEETDEYLEWAAEREAELAAAAEDLTNAANFACPW